MLSDLRLHWRSYRPFVLAPLLLVVLISGVVFAVIRNDSDGGNTALRTDAPPTSNAGELEAAAVEAPETLTSNAAGATLVVADSDVNTSPPSSLDQAGAEDQTSTTTEASAAVPSSTQPPATGTTQQPAATQPPTDIQTRTSEQVTTDTTQPPTTKPQSTCESNGEFELVFRDDFNGSAIGPAWRQYNSIGNNDFGLRRPSANAVADGRLVITAQMESGQLVSGGMAHTYDQQYGKYVFRVRTDDDPDMATSGVVLTWPESQVHPRDGENNIYETLAHTPQRTQFFSVIHKPFGQKGDQEYFIHRANGAVFQTMTMEWRPDRITLIRQGEDPNDREVFEVTETSADLVPDNPHHVTIQLDAWKHEMRGPVQMEVDYIEVHKYCG